MTGDDGQPARRRGGIVVVAVLAAATLAVVVGVLVTRPEGPRTPVTGGGWSGQPILCAYSGEPDDLDDLPIGAAHALGDDPSAVLADARCSAGSARAEGRVPELRDDRTYFVVDTGRDRIEVSLVGVDLDGAQASLEVQVTVPGRDCVSTAEYRGQLMLLVEAPADAALPEVSLVDVPLDC